MLNIVIITFILIIILIVILLIYSVKTREQLVRVYYSALQNTKTTEYKESLPTDANKISVKSASGKKYGVAQLSNLRVLLIEVGQQKKFIVLYL